MARHCSACGMPLNADHHDIDRRPGWFVDGMTASGRVRHSYRDKLRHYACRVELVATSPATGKTLTTKSPQRVKELDTRFVRK